jgi:beta-lactamase regulating signal transducer with metallopeptidase domain
MSALHGLLPLPALLPLGWTLVLTLWQTTLLALLVWAWSRTGRGASALRRHRVAYLVLLSAAALAILTFALLRHPTAVRALAPAPALGSVAVQSAPGTPESSRSFPSLPGMLPDALAPPARETIGWLALGWLAVASLLVLRLAGGIFFVRRIRRRATPLDSGIAVESAVRLGARLGLRRAVKVLESDAIAAPAAVGWLRPALILPRGFEASLAPHLLEPVLVHELEHVRRRDQPLAIVQALVDALLFFCPGALWLSAHARQAREERCDDAAVSSCGDPGRYAEALAILASRASGPRLAAALGLGAPRLADRIRRVLKGEPMSRLSRVQRVALAVGILTTAASGSIVLASALRQTGSRQSEIAGSETTTPATGAQPGTVPTSYATQQLGAPISITGAWGTGDHAFTRVRVRNTSEQRVVAVTFLGVVERDPRVNPTPGPAILVKADPVATGLDPGQAGELSLAFLPVSQLLEWTRTRETHAQAMLAVLDVEFADGDHWAVTPRAGARNAMEALHMPKFFVSRARVVAAGSQSQQGSGRSCRDDLGLENSTGALVRIAESEGDPGGWARCDHGVWRETQLPGWPGR